jgi:hypothetical protein
VLQAQALNLNSSLISRMQGISKIVPRLLKATQATEPDESSSLRSFNYASTQALTNAVGSQQALGTRHESTASLPRSFKQVSERKFYSGSGLLSQSNLH